jgi:hypothetical protein
LLAKLWNPLINLISLSVSNADSGTSPIPMRLLDPTCHFLFPFSLSVQAQPVSFSVEAQPVHAENSDSSHTAPL